MPHSSILNTPSGSVVFPRGFMLMGILALNPGADQTWNWDQVNKYINKVR